MLFIDHRTPRRTRHCLQNQRCFECMLQSEYRGGLKPQMMNYKAKLQLQQVFARLLCFLCQVQLRLRYVKQQKQTPSVSTALFALQLQPYRVCQHRLCVPVLFLLPSCLLFEQAHVLLDGRRTPREEVTVLHGSDGCSSTWPARTPTRVMTRQTSLPQSYL